MLSFFPFFFFFFCLSFFILPQRSERSKEWIMEEKRTEKFWQTKAWRGEINSCQVSLVGRVGKLEYDELVQVWFDSDHYYHTALLFFFFFSFFTAGLLFLGKNNDKQIMHVMTVSMFGSPPPSPHALLFLFFNPLFCV